MGSGKWGVGTIWEYRLLRKIYEYSCFKTSKIVLTWPCAYWDPRKHLATRLKGFRSQLEKGTRLMSPQVDVCWAKAGLC